MAQAAKFQAESSAAHTEAPRPRAVWGLSAALALLVPFSLPAAIGLMDDPSGASLQIPANYRALLPVADFFLVGLFLLAFYTVAPPIIILGLLTRGEVAATRWVSERARIHWSWFAAVALAAVLMAWIATEMYLFASAPSTVMTALWLVCLAVAAAIVLSAAPRKVRVYYRVEPRPRPAGAATAS